MCIKKYIRVNKCIKITYVVQRQVLQNVKNKGNRQESKIIKNAKMLHKKLYYKKKIMCIPMADSHPTDIYINCIHPLFIHTPLAASSLMLYNPLTALYPNIVQPP